MYVDGGEALRPRDRRVLSALTVRRGHLVTPAEIADAVWGDDPPPSWTKQVQICMVRLRKALGPGVIETVAGGYCLQTERVELDVADFEQLLDRGRQFVREDAADRGASAFTRALSVWHGAPFNSIDEWPPAQAESSRLEELHQSAEEDLLEARLLVGEHREVASQAEALVAEEPLRERRWAILALAQYHCGRQGDALHSVELARELLLDQLGVDPGAELVALQAGILRQDLALRPSAAPRAVSRDCPYKGMAFYDTGELLFGRDSEVAACVARLRSSPLLVVAGASGCGKSSLVRAGLIPALARVGRTTVVVVPGPTSTLALPDVNTHVAAPVLVIDQFEELFTGNRSADMIRDCLTRLVDYAQNHGPVIIAVRADHLAGLGAEPWFSRLAESGLHLVNPLRGDCLREAIEKPAEGAGLRVEKGLVELVMRDAEGAPGALPLMSHALAETWLRRDGTVLTVEGYQSSGGIQGAVARSADRLHDSLSPAQRSILRSVLLRLVTLSPDGDPVRRRVAGSALRSDAEREQVVALLIGARLLTAENEVVEISHEALAHAWPRLRSWLEDDTAGQRILRHLTAAAEGWESLGRPDSELYRGARLETAAEYRQKAHPHLTVVEIAYLDASLKSAASTRAGLRARAQYDARRSRRLRALLGAAVCLLVLSLVSVALAVDNAGQVGDQRDVAEVATREAGIEALVNQSLALRGTDRDVAALLAVEAARRWPQDPRSTGALLGSFTAAPGFLGYQYVADAESLNGALVPGTSQAVVDRDGRRLTMLDLDTGEVDDRFPPTPVGAGSGLEVRVSGNGRSVVQLLTTEQTRPCPDRAALRSTNRQGCASIRVYDVATGDLVLERLTPPVGPGDVAINQDGSLVAVAGGYDGDLALYDTRSGELLGAVAGPGRPAGAEQVVDTAAVGFDVDGRVYIGSLAGPIRVVDPMTLEVVKTLEAPPYSSHQHLVVGTDGIVVAGGQQSLVATDASTGVVRWSVDIRGTHPDPCPWFTVSEAVGAVFCGSHFGEIEQRDRTTGQRTGVTLDPQLGSVGDLTTSRDGLELVSFGSQVPAVSRWRLDGSGPVTDHVAAGHVVYDGYDFNQGRTLLVAKRGPASTSDVDFTDFALWDPKQDREVDPLDVPFLGTGWAGADTLTGFQPDEQRFGWYDVTKRSVVKGARVGGDCDHLWASAGGTRAYCGFTDGRVWTIDSLTRQRIDPTLHVGRMPSSVSATKGGKTIVVTAQGPSGYRTTVHHADTGKQTGPAMAGPHLTSVSLDGVLVGATGGDIRTYDLNSLEPIADLPGAHGEVNTLQFSDDGTLLLATSNDQSASLYDVATGFRLGDPIPSAAPFIYPAFLRHDGGAIAVTDTLGVAIWDLDPTRLLEAACRLAGRNLTATEWSSYLGSMGPRRNTCPQFPD